MLKVPVVSAYSPGQLPDTLDWIELWAVWRQEIKADTVPVFSKPWCEKPCMMPAGVVEDNDCECVFPLMPQELFQEREKCGSVESLSQTSHQVPVSIPDSSKNGDTFSCGGMKHYRVSIFRRYPHCTP